MLERRIRTGRNFRWLFRLKILDLLDWHTVVEGKRICSLRVFTQQFVEFLGRWMLSLWLYRFSIVLLSSIYVHILVNKLLSSF